MYGRSSASVASYNSLAMSADMIRSQKPAQEDRVKAETWLNAWLPRRHTGCVWRLSITLGRSVRVLIVKLPQSDPSLTRLTNKKLTNWLGQQNAAPPNLFDPKPSFLTVFPNGSSQ